MRNKYYIVNLPGGLIYYGGRFTLGQGHYLQQFSELNVKQLNAKHQLF